MYFNSSRERRSEPSSKRFARRAVHAVKLIDADRSAVRAQAGGRFSGISVTAQPAVSVKQAGLTKRRVGQVESRRLQGRLLAGCLCCFASAATAADSILQLSPTPSRDGVATLSWDSAGDVVLQQSASEDFATPTTLYQGPDKGTTITGLNDGTYYYRIGISAGPDTATRWQAPVRLVVEHHSMARAWGFFSLGAVVFLGTLIVVVRGARLNGNSNQ
jgi:hypothetical protein